ncbi:hypothetical protein BVG19_g4301 [[Candida] boidinii]|nr:hypothetical protein BVG19_g4301 [[Candida] boidinii]OWB51290.1 hypothetical protein B5S27_g2850 [[Candida] boidinii]
MLAIVLVLIVYLLALLVIVELLYIKKHGKGFGIMSGLSSNWASLQKKQKPSKFTRYKKIDTTTRNPKSTVKNVRVMSKAVAASLKLEDEQNQQQQQQQQPQHQQMDGVKYELPSDTDTKFSNRQLEIGKYVAIDCEFVGVGPEGVASSLARVSIVNFHGKTIFDSFVRPTEKVTDWRTWVSGVTPKDMKDAITFKEAQNKTSEILKNRILVGHAVDHDLDALMLSHPKSMIRDTARHTPYRQKYAKGKTPSLKNLTKEILGIDIQTGEHSSVEDAKATMMIFRNDKKTFEQIATKRFRRANHNHRQ